MKLGNQSKMKTDFDNTTFSSNISMTANNNNNKNLFQNNNITD